MNLGNILLVFFGGGLGAASRYVVTTIVGARFGSAFPYGTLTVNVIGSFIIGLLTFYFLTKNGGVPDNLRLLLVVGFLGGFTTFSSFALDTLNLGNSAEMGLVFLNIFSNVGATLLAVFIGMLAGKAIA